MKLRTLLHFILAGMLAAGCEDLEQHDYPNLNIFLDRFADEARQRGYDLDLSAVQTEYVESINREGRTFCGYGFPDYDGNGTRRIEISQTCQWAYLGDADREILAFHELGHAFLNRTHDNSLRCDGSPASMMSGGVLPTYRADDVEKRTYYIDELFDQLTKLTQCIDYGQDFATNPQFYANTSGDTEWIFYSSNGLYTGEHGQSITINSASGASSENSYWYKQISSPAIPKCAEVKLRVKMNSAGLTGPGAGIAVRVYDNLIARTGASTEQIEFVTTEDNPVSGVLSNHIKEVIIPCFSPKTTVLIIFVVMLPGTTGQVSFDDIEVLVKE
ncbi:MAG TPA: hypothetical protein VK658_17600 [Chryseolinea sp.]|nr:hypothetical protein [Chryseolinea sp.]